MSKSRKANQGSVLRKQKPKTNKNRRRLALSKWKTLALLGVAVSLVSLGYFAAKGTLTPLISGHFPSTIGAATNWDLLVRSSDDQRISDASRALVISTARKSLGGGTHEDLVKTARAVQKLGVFSDVRVTKISPFQVIVSIIQRNPVFCIEADKIRFVSTLGDIYGHLDTNHGEACPGPVLTGLFEDRQQFSMGEGQTLVVDDQTRVMLQEALTLLQDTKKKSINISKFHVERFRGFVAELTSLGTEVALGRAPFAEKLEKLGGILEKLAVRQEQAQRIELDYQGKAFVKLKKM
ncbi:MAG: hypothetical protein FJ146_03505 [Deltaproteobacteria bacterium]|nr:hypothetical protein [Deltaproteobacteria bacterium]